MSGAIAREAADLGDQPVPVVSGAGHAMDEDDGFGGVGRSCIDDR